MLTTLLSLYWMPNEPAELREAQMTMWLEDLEAFDVPVIADAIKEWRQQPGGRRPTPGDIYQLCTGHNQANRQLLAIESRHQSHMGEMQDMWSRPEYEGDERSWQQRRQEAIEAQEDRYRRAAELRAQRVREQTPKQEAAE